MMTQLELIETIKTLPVQALLPLQEAIEQRLSSLTVDEKVALQSEYTPTPEQSAELERLIAAHERGELHFTPFKEAMAELRARFQQ